MGRMTREARMIASITSHEELDGYEKQAKTRGITTEEVRLIAEKRRALGVKK